MPPMSAFAVVRRAPVADTITAAENDKLIGVSAESADRWKWEVVARESSDVMKMHVIVAGQRVPFSDRAQAELSADFVRQFAHSLRSGMRIDVVPYESERQWQEGCATKLNDWVD